MQKKKSLEIAAAENDETVQINKINSHFVFALIAERNMSVMKGIVDTQEKTCRWLIFPRVKTSDTSTEIDWDNVKGGGAGGDGTEMKSQLMSEEEEGEEMEWRLKVKIEEGFFTVGYPVLTACEICSEHPVAFNHQSSEATRKLTPKWKERIGEWGKDSLSLSETCGSKTVCQRQPFVIKSTIELVLS